MSNFKLIVVSLVLFLMASCATDKIAGGNTSETGDVVAGIIYRSDGVTPAEGVQVYFLSANYLPGVDSLAVYADSTVTDATGSFTFDSVDSGHYVLTAVDTGSLGVRISDIHMETDSIDIPPAALQTTGSITGTLHLIDPTTPVTIKVYGLPRTFALNTDGSYLLDDLPAGRYEIRFETPDLSVEFLDSLAVTVTSGVPTQMDTVMVPALKSFLPKGFVCGIYADSGLVYIRTAFHYPTRSLFIYDILNAASPGLLGQFDSLAGYGSVMVKNGFAFISQDGILDIRDPADIRRINNLNTGEYYESLDGNTLFGPSSVQNFRIRTVGYLWDTTAAMVTSNLPINWAYDVAAKDGYVYTPTSAGLRVIDIQEPSTPVLADSIPIAWPVESKYFPPNTIESQVEIKGDYLFAYLTATFSDHENELIVFDLSTDPVRPEKIGSTIIPLPASAGGNPCSHFAVNRSHAFILYKSIAQPIRDDKIQVVDIQDPHSPEVGPVIRLHEKYSSLNTIFSWDRYIFVGTFDGLMILEVGE